MAAPTNRPLLACAIAAIAWATLVSPARADVIDRARDGFTVTITTEMAAPPDAVYSAVVQHIGDWWEMSHTWSGNPKNLSIVARPGGCFCETLPGGGGVQHASVVYVAPGKLLRMVGGLGPLQQLAVVGTLSWSFEKSGASGTTFTLTYVVGGY